MLTPESFFSGKAEYQNRRKFFFKHSSTISFISPVREKHSAFWKQEAEMPVVIIQIFCKVFGNIDSPAFGTLGLKDIKIAFIQMHIFLGKCANLLTTEATAVQETEHGWEY